MTHVLPIRRQIVVPGAREVAFEVFTEEIGLWWPVDELSVHGKGTMVGFHDGRLVERAPDGAEAVWGTVVDWEPPHRFVMTWHPGRDPSRASEVEVGFARITDGLTMVSVTHRGWERFADPAAARAEFERGWPAVLSGYGERASRVRPAAPDEGPVWLALMHTAGPSLPAGGQITEHPDFPEHVAFLLRLREAGVLVAAGPLDGPVSGMTILRVPDPARVAEYTRLAQDEDDSVTRGLLQVWICPWSVALVG
jgi:uncharacterized protein YndB with AHSA1/START domain/uncharacterized protein YciI